MALHLTFDTLLAQNMECDVQRAICASEASDLVAEQDSSRRVGRLIFGLLIYLKSHVSYILSGNCLKR